MDLKMEVYSPSLELLGLLEIQQSVIWETKAFSAGSFSLNSLITEESRAMLTPENIIWIAGEDAGIIEYVQQQAGESGPYITVKGCGLTGILARRILWGRYDLSGPVPALMYQLVDDCCIHPTRGDTEARVIPGLRLSDVPAGGTSIQSQKTGGTLLEALELLGEAYQVPFGVRFVPEVPCMEFWARPGVNRSVHQTVNELVFYSTELDDVLSSEYSYNAQDYKNVALVAGEGEGDARTLVTVYGKVEPEPEPPTPPEPAKYTITLSVDPAGGGLASGGGEVEEGKRITVTAAPATGYSFAGWSEGGAIVSTSPSYTFTVNGDRALVAVFAVVPTSRLPDGYTEVEYIQADGKEYIDPGVLVRDKSTDPTTIKIIMDIAPSPVNTLTTQYYFGYAGYGNNGGGFGMSRYRLKSFAYLTTGTNTFITVATSDSTERRLVILDGANGTASVGDNQVSLTGDAPCVTFYLLAQRSKESTGAFSTKYYMSGNLYGCKIEKMGVLVRNFVPCIDPTGVVGLYDLANDMFYKNANTTGTFTPGPTV